MFLVHIYEKIYLKIDHVDEKMLSLRQNFNNLIILTIKKIYLWH